MVKSLRERTHVPVAEEKVVTITIASKDFADLKQNGYCLCFAKKLSGEDYDVVWQSYDKEEYLENNTFSWKPAFQVFGSNTFQDKMKVVVSTNVIDIQLGEQCTLDANGNLDDVKVGSHPNSIDFINEFGDIHPGVNALCYDLKGNQQISPIYVAQKAIVIGTDTLTPIEVVQVWFEQDIETSTMFSNARTNIQEIDLTNQSSASYLYKDGTWHPTS
jgi:hypothetical protein